MCAIILPDQRSSHYYAYATFSGGLEPLYYPPFNATDTPLIDSIADREMWLHLCTQFSPAVVRVYGISNFTPPSLPDRPTASGTVEIVALYYADGYPATADVLDQDKVVQKGIHPEKNLYPACFYAPSDPDEAAWVAGTAIRTKLHMPDCPAGFVQDPKKPIQGNPPSNLMWKRLFQTDDMKDNVARWSLRGGIATGMAVFSYLQTGGAQRHIQPYYNQCQLLK
jgi:hypothetical protein